MTQTDMQEKKFHKNKGKTYLQPENNQLIMHAKPKEKKTEFLKPNIRVLNTLSRKKYECQLS